MSNCIRSFSVMAAASILLSGCGQSNAESGLSESERSLIDNQLEKCDLLPSSPRQACAELERLKGIPSLATSESGRGYALTKAHQYRRRITGELQKLLRKHAEANITYAELLRTYAATVSRRFGQDWEVVSMHITNAQFIPDGEELRAEFSHTLSLRQHTGLFQKDVFTTNRATQTIVLRANCSDEPAAEVLEWAVAQISR